jgi:hypothetical protein
VSVDRAVVRASYEGDNSVLDRDAFTVASAEHIERWLIAVAAWIEVLSGQTFRHRGDSVLLLPPKNQRSALRVDRSKERADRFATPKPNIRFDLAGPLPAVTVEMWTAATRNVNEAIEPPLAHVLLRDARRALRARDDRRAVIDAASATEVALAEAIRGRFQADDRDAVEVILRRLSGVTDLYGV